VTGRHGPPGQGRAGPSAGRPDASSDTSPTASATSDLARVTPAGDSWAALGAVVATVALGSTRFAADSVRTPLVNDPGANVKCGEAATAPRECAREGCGEPNFRPRSPYCDKRCAETANRQRRRLSRTHIECAGCGRPMACSKCGHALDPDALPSAHACGDDAPRVRSTRLYHDSACRAKAWRAREREQAQLTGRRRRGSGDRGRHRTRRQRHYDWDASDSVRPPMPDYYPARPRPPEPDPGNGAGQSRGGAP
jgi:hypothetical protein